MKLYLLLLSVSVCVCVLYQLSEINISSSFQSSSPLATGKSSTLKQNFRAVSKQYIPTILAVSFLRLFFDIEGLAEDVSFVALTSLSWYKLTFTHEKSNSISKISDTNVSFYFSHCGVGFPTATMLRSVQLNPDCNTEVSINGMMIRLLNE
ncbi:hypothetical protein J3Q64DRAFT_1692856 [Phycomyces blakesleeanus]|uniref:Uncharacterized protein n=2 Tax=Phycomyces blakesleeanus TaxID=4837 RepID=A0A162Y011_PHYB8|nr:hypothetical protein PHYBLDRAFT_60627 [Phycomyces blakesleeanus NRRL 1555(-)]OAD77495.1 hypothetical protein PHYBLDRAFT_60627 [Phycomyces blakesleeanus NRRL 1555(-)]|eukprot:XP_018295535.1 hypothetical protein PHYBLDRAFT_60627 [Phycomyces blakesleeanus NRRL 1555(-)]